MYCKRCKNLLPENVYICNNCNFDNSLYYEYKNTLKSNKVKKKKQNSSFSVVALFILVCLGVVTFYSFNDNMTYGKVLSTPPKEVIVKKNNFCERVTRRILFISILNSLILRISELVQIQYFTKTILISILI